MSKYNFSVVCGTQSTKRNMCSISFSLPSSIRINRSVINTLGSPKAIRILYDLAKNVVAIQRAAEDDPDAILSPAKTRTLAYKNQTFKDIILHNGWTENMHVSAIEVEDDMVIFDLSKADTCSEISPGRKAETLKVPNPISEEGSDNLPFSRLRSQFIDVVSKAQGQ